MFMSSRTFVIAVAGATLLIGCKKDDAPATKPADDSTGKKGGDKGEGKGGDKGKGKKDVTAKPFAKKETKPGAAANGHNVPLELGPVTDKPIQEDRGHFVLRYEGKDSETRAMVRASGTFEKLLPQLDQSLRLPRDIKVVFSSCDEVNAFYDPEQVEITMCNEYVDYYGELFAEYPPVDARNAIIGSTVSTFLHEIGHALIEQLDLPAIGREEDAADQLSTIILVASGDEGNAMAMEGAYAFIAESEAGEEEEGEEEEGDDGAEEEEEEEEAEEETAFWDEHSLDEQRFYNSICLIYGSDPEGWEDLVGDDDLPQERADQCPGEYELISTSWNRLLEPYLTVPAVRVNLPK